MADLSALVNFYKEAVEREDANGFAEVFKQATEMLFEQLPKALSWKKDLVFTVEDVIYLDGYFMFGRGTNSVVHFHIKETPGWLYGIWWSPVEDKEASTGEKKVYVTDRLHCDIFAQFEEEIDKFKPSASMVSDSFNFWLDSKSNGSLWNIARDILFIRDEPYLAFYRDIHFSDFNREYVSRETAELEYKSYLKKKQDEIEIKALNNKEMLDFINEAFAEFIEQKAFIVYDRGSSWSPRYNLVMKNIFVDSGLEDGTHELFEMGFDGEDDCRADYKKLLAECERRAADADIWWSKPFHGRVDVVSEERFNLYLQED